jgi:hypothetical protein
MRSCLCASKFLLPFAWPFAAGQWIGYPVRFAGDPVPATLSEAAARLTPWVAPVRSAVLTRGGATLALVAAAAVAWLCLRYAFFALRVESARDASERSADLPVARPLGFANAALFTFIAIALVSTPLLGGAIANRNWRNALLIENARTLRDAPVTLEVAAPGMGERSRVVAGDDGVLIRNANIRELIAMSYGVSEYAVWTNQMFSAESDPGMRPWWLTPRYDLRVRARIREPDEFETYALRQRITRLLVERFGIELQVNGVCQVPCGRWDTRRDDSAD